MLRPPKNVSCIRSETVGCPVVVALHGYFCLFYNHSAGVEASSPFWVYAYNQQNFAWMLFPSGRTPWYDLNNNSLGVTIGTAYLA